jgi:hypothetical protein
MLNNPGISQASFSELQPLASTADLMVDTSEWALAVESDVKRNALLLQARGAAIEIFVTYLDPTDPNAVESQPIADNYGFVINPGGSLVVSGNRSVYTRVPAGAGNGLLILQAYGIAEAELILATA